MKKRIYNQTSLFGPAYAYLIVLSPPSEIRNSIVCIKQDLDALGDIGGKNRHSIPHITLRDKLTDDESLPYTIKELLKRNGNKPFLIKVNGWGYFDHQHSVTIYLKIENPEPIVDLMAALRSSSRTPHISLAKRISYTTFDTMRPYLDKLEYSAEWLCSEIVVLRKLMSKKELGFKDKYPIPLQDNNENNL
ncbi:2'-5' RNA ligase family protein [Sphingobacterium siyangense]|uniref:2'-5' RNA ligase family protein n=1 Tax=Sphingobacterium siyangense TaxID=459529 RepID=UPI001962C8FA|nr:2'-5' RNA ligase family protein [Sphingobacterium siyangense]QRY55467.1 2'-5' RNA ligase family protein [Sphingobacterium siyangense]